jgi:hypothetical protein
LTIDSGIGNLLKIRGEIAVIHSDDLSGFGAFNQGNDLGNPHNGLGPEVTLSDDGALSPMHSATGHGGSGGGSSYGRVTAPTPTTVSSGNLAIELIWDTNIVSAGSTVETEFMNTVTAAAKLLVADLGATTTHKDTVYIDVGWGEVAGQSLSPSALGESSTNGYLVQDSTLAPLLASHKDTPGSDPSITSTTQFFLPSAEAKALGLAGASPGSVYSPDGYIGFSTLAGTGYSWQYTDASGNPLTAASSTMFSAYGVALHEISEAMGRISMEGLATYNGHKTYTPLDLFDYAGTPATNPTHTLALSNTGGYFSANGGATASGIFNNSKANSGDIADWASYYSPNQSGTTVPAGEEDAFNAFGWPGYNDALSPEDVLVMQTLGY